MTAAQAGGAPGYDLFISYAEDDRQWVDEYLIPQTGVAPERVVTAAEFQPGKPRAEEFERAVLASRYILLVWTKAFESSPWLAYVEKLATHSSLEAGLDNVIVLARDASDLPLRLNVNVWLDCQTPRQWDAAVGQVRRCLSLPKKKWVRPACPYPGMKTFEAKTTGDGPVTPFFGRDDEIDTLESKVRSQSLTVVVSDSGCGKSSLVAAGLIPRLEARGAGRWAFAQMRPGAKPLTALAEALHYTGNSAETKWEERARACLPQRPDARLLLVIDQLEELFVQAEEREQAAFFGVLATLRAMPDCALLLLVRSDFFYSQVLTWPLGKLHEGEKMDLGPLAGNALRDAIVGPARRRDVYVEDRLVDRLIIDGDRQRGFLPMLQETLVALWERADFPVLTLQAYEKLGRGQPGIAWVLNENGNAAMSGLSDERRAIAWRILLRLVQFGENRADTRRQQRLESLRSAAENARDFQFVLDRLLQKRLIVLGDPIRTGQRYVDLAHEVLIEGWEPFQAEIKRLREGEIQRRRLTAKLEEWIRLGCGRSGLLDDAGVADAKSWIASDVGIELGVPEQLDTMIGLSQPERRRLCGRADDWIRLGRGRSGVLDAAEVAEAERWLAGENAAQYGIPEDVQHLVAGSREELRRRRRIRISISIAGIALIAVASVATKFWLQTSRANKSIQMAERAKDRFKHDDPGENSTGLKSAIEAADLSMTPSALEALQEGIQRVGGPVARMAGSGGVQSMMVSTGFPPVFAGEDGVKELGTGVQKLAADPNLKFRSVARSSTGGIAAGAFGGPVYLWAKDGSPRPNPLTNDTDVISLAFSPDGSLLAAGRQDGKIELWKLSERTPPRELTVSEDYPINQLVFSADGALLASAGADHEATLWNVRDGTRHGASMRHPAAVNGIAFYGQTQLVTVGADAFIRFWDWNSGNKVKEVPVVDTSVQAVPLAGLSAVAVDSAGMLAVGFGAEQKVELRDAKQHAVVLTLLGIHGRVTGLAFSGSQTDETLYTAEDSGALRAYPLNPQRLLEMARQGAPRTP